jgi:hypothetical protein
MHTLSGPIGPEGALVDVLIGLSAPAVQVLRNAGSPVPPPVSARALLDTGAEVSGADPAVLTPLAAHGLQPLRFVFANLPAAGGVRFAPQYNVTLTVVHPSGNPRANLLLRNHPVLELALAPLGYQAVIGRDVLDRCLLLYNGPGGSFTLAY